jgi:hypothetical protein
MLKLLMMFSVTTLLLIAVAIQSDQQCLHGKPGVTVACDATVRFGSGSAKYTVTRPAEHR